MDESREAEAFEAGLEDSADVGTVEVQILLSWFFETADPAEYDYIRSVA